MHGVAFAGKAQAYMMIYYFPKYEISEIKAGLIFIISLSHAKVAKPK